MLTPLHTTCQNNKPMYAGDMPRSFFRSAPISQLTEPVLCALQHHPSIGAWAANMTLSTLDEAFFYTKALSAQKYQSL